MNFPQGEYYIEIKGINFTGKIIAIDPGDNPNNEFDDTNEYWTLEESYTEYNARITAQKRFFKKV